MRELRVDLDCGRGRDEYLEVAINVLDDLLFIIILDDAGLDEIVEFGEDEGFFHVVGQSLGRGLCQR